MKPPEHLSDATKRTWRRITAEYELTADAALLLRAALENWDRAQAARELVTAEGLVKDGRKHPAVDIEQKSYALFSKLIRQLGLDIVEPGPVGRPARSVA